MVRPESDVELAGGSPVAVSADAPCSRPRAWEEIPASEWAVKSSQGVVRLSGGAPVRRRSAERILQPRERNTRNVGLAEPLMAWRRQQPLHVIGTAADACGVETRACGHSSMWNRRAASRRPALGDGAPYKPKVKGERARAGVRGVRSTADAGDHDVGRGKGSCFGRGNVREVSARAWSRDPTPPPTPVIRYEDSSGACSQWIAEAGRHGETRQASVPEGLPAPCAFGGRFWPE